MTDSTQEEKAPETEAAPAEATQEAAAEEKPVDPSVVGELNAEESEKFLAFRRNSNQAAMELGQMFIRFLQTEAGQILTRGTQILGALEAQQAEFQTFSKGVLESRELNKEGYQYQLGGDEKIREIKVPTPQGAPAPAAPAAEAPAAEEAPAEEVAQIEQLEAALAKAKANLQAKTAT